jgi:methylenetetrahydrofolate dehydrogenase (NADP+)/methenyltetrahydrofolate cyclohydrolase
MQELRGMPVVNMFAEKFRKDVNELNKKGINPKLAVVRVGEREDDLAYEKGIIKRFSAVSAMVDVIQLKSDCSRQTIEDTVQRLNDDKNVHGILIFRPLPKSLSEDSLKYIISGAKDVDGMAIENIAHVFSGSKNCFPPCTPQAVIELMDYYKINPEGKKVTIIGRSMVTGKPLSMLLLGRNATVTICHTKTKNLADECKEADILISCAGVPRMVKEDFVRPEQIVIDVGINVENGKLCGDVDYDAVSDIVKAITPVPGGVGTVTTSVLLKHTIHSAKMSVF